MSDTTGYNGWKNYETWVMNLWMTNDEGSDSYARELTAEVLADEDDEYKRVTLADRLKEWQEEDMPELDASVWSDLLNAGFGEIDWVEIADNLIDAES